ncbi:hypothetical protein HGRIS_012620 [Hohenbuehelia grisea]|uniref:Uncharacterized protein n=1 Tax=Hohenbuehelia grisea TaxID=104357 RepID=A0ABR3IT45_9AGAR
MPEDRDPGKRKRQPSDTPESLSSAPKSPSIAALQTWLASENSSGFKHLFGVSYKLRGRTYGLQIYCNQELKHELPSDVRDLVFGPEHDWVLDVASLSVDMEPIDALIKCFVKPSQKASTEQRAPRDPTSPFAEAAEKSWRQPFIGDAHVALWNYIVQIFMLANVYVNYLTILNSSGCGKTRVIDEISKIHLVIPMCLRAVGTNGYPPPDGQVGQFLLESRTRADTNRHYLAFFHALFLRLIDIFQSEEFRDLPYVEVAAKFRLCMTESMTMLRHNDFRETFYNDVIAKAWQTAGKISHESHALEDVVEAFKALIDNLTQRSRQASDPKPGPLVILAFDEAQGFSEQRTDAGWSKFGELCYVLRGLAAESLFSVFLSTTRKVSRFAQPSYKDNTSRIGFRQFDKIPPFCDFGLDLLTRQYPRMRLSLSGQWTLQSVAEDEFMVHLGRPLFGQQWLTGNAKVQSELLYFATQKLLNHMHGLPKNLDTAQALACLFTRLPLEFVTSVYNNTDRETEQVEGHMRICLKAHPNHETMVTVSASEPFLSEAAYFAMSRCTDTNIVYVFRELVTGFCVGAGDRGEYLAMLLLTLARDAAVGPPNKDSGHPSSRVFFLHEFLTHHLIKTDKLDKSTQNVFAQLATDFRDAKMHFNHYIKLHEQSAIDRDCLLLQSGRGAAIMCAPNQTSIDLIHPFLVNGDLIVPDNAGLGLIQVNNDEKYGLSSHGELFQSMDPYHLGILQADDPPVPLVRIVFALASRKSGVVAVRHAPSEEYNAVRYDIWIAGLSSDFLHPIRGNDDEDIWNAILGASHGWRGIYCDEGVRPEKDSRSKYTVNTIRQSAHPATALDAGHWTNWCLPPRQVHREGQLALGKGSQRKGKEHAKGHGQAGTNEQGRTETEAQGSEKTNTRVAAKPEAPVAKKAKRTR